MLLYFFLLRQKPDRESSQSSGPAAVGAAAPVKPINEFNPFKLTYDQIVGYGIGQMPERVPSTQRLESINPEEPSTYDDDHREMLDPEQKSNPYFHEKERDEPLSHGARVFKKKGKPKDSRPLVEAAQSDDH